MSYTVQILENDITGFLHGTSLDQITNLNGLINRAARQLLLDVDPQETKRIVQLSPVFSNVYDYPLVTIAPDLKGQKIVDIGPQVNRMSYDNYTQQYSQDFDIQKLITNVDAFTVQFNTGLKTIRINNVYCPNPPVSINNADALTDNGSWAVSGTASNLTVDNVNYIFGTGGALQFNMTTGAGGIVNSTQSAVNLSSTSNTNTNFVNQSSMFLYGYFPTASQITSVVLQWGSSASNYYQVTATQSQAGTSFVNGWNLIQFPWNNSTTVVGTPDPTKITYIQVTVNATANQTGIHINNIFCALPTILNMTYYSKYLFQNAITGAWQETVTDPSNIINLDTESYNLLLNQCGYLLAQQTQGLDALFYDASFFENVYTQGVTRYQAMYKSEVKLPQTTYYQMPIANPVQYWNQWYNR